MTEPQTSTAPNLWLVRTADNRIIGPITREEVRQLIEEGKIGFQDEVCHANQYWFFLHESDEVLKQLGLTLSNSPADEETLTSPEVDSDKTDPAIGPASELEAPEETAIIKMPKLAPKSAAPGVIPKAPTDSPAVVHSGAHSVERPFLWRGFAFLLLAAAGVLIILVLKALRGER